MVLTRKESGHVFVGVIRDFHPSLLCSFLHHRSLMCAKCHINNLWGCCCLKGKKPPKKFCISRYSTWTQNQNCSALKIVLELLEEDILIYRIFLKNLFTEERGSVSVFNKVFPLSCSLVVFIKNKNEMVQCSFASIFFFLHYHKISPAQTHITIRFASALGALITFAACSCQNVK